MGSISGGGRYDGLIGMFSGKNIPSVGGSIGIERIFSILEENEREKTRPIETNILVTSMGKNLTAKRLEACSILWNAGIKAETLYKERPMMEEALKTALNNGIPLLLIIGESEIEKGIYKVKSLNEKKEYEFSKEELVPKVMQLIEANPVLTSQEEDN